MIKILYIFSCQVQPSPPRYSVLQTPAALISLDLTLSWQLRESEVSLFVPYSRNCIFVCLLLFHFVSLNIRNHVLKMQRLCIIFSSLVNVFFSFYQGIQVKTDHFNLINDWSLGIGFQCFYKTRSISGLIPQAQSFRSPN